VPQKLLSLAVVADDGTIAEARGSSTARARAAAAYGIRGRHRGDDMKATRILHDLGQSLWLDNITRGLLKTGVLRRYIDELSVTGLTSNPTIFDHAIKNSGDYDDAIKSKLAERKSGEKLFFEVALEDLTQAADLFRPIHDRTCGVDGWVSLEVSPLLAHDTKSTIAVAKELHAQAQRPNVMIKIPGTPEGLPAIEEAIFAGVPINVTLLFSDDQYLAAANAFMRGIERRIEAGLKPDIPSVASIFISRWDVAAAGKVSESLHNRLGIAVAKRTYKAYLDLLSSPRWMRAYNAGARPQRLLWASTGTKDPKASDILYVNALAAPFTVNTMPEGTLKALAEHGDVRETIPTDSGNSEEELARFATAGVDVHALSIQLQDEGAKSFVKSWNELMDVINSKSAVLKRAS
jgi:transaldolase